MQFATSVMHAYGHQWTCQLAYNPRLKPGLGLTDGEGVERLWSRLRKLIGVTRMSTVSLFCPSFFQLDLMLVLESASYTIAGPAGCGPEL